MLGEQKYGIIGDLLLIARLAPTHKAESGAIVPRHRSLPEGVRQWRSWKIHVIRLSRGVNSQYDRQRLERQLCGLPLKVYYIRGTTYSVRYDR